MKVIQSNFFIFEDFYMVKLWCFSWAISRAGRRIQHVVKHRKWSFLQKYLTAKYLREKFNLRCFFWESTQSGVKEIQMNIFEKGHVQSHVHPKVQWEVQDYRKGLLMLEIVWKEILSRAFKISRSTWNGFFPGKIISANQIPGFFDDRYLQKELWNRFRLAMGRWKRNKTEAATFT